MKRLERKLPPAPPVDRTLAIGIVMHDFHDLKTMTVHHVAEIAYF